MLSDMTPIADQATSRRKRAIPSPKILLVDDDPDLVRVLGLRLRGNSYEVVAAGDAYGAITSAEKERPDLIILDLGLPDGDGFVVLERLRKMGYLSTVPVIVLTAREPATYEQRALKAGATAFFQKPADNNELLNAIRISLNPGEA
ncbi:MAG: response regulator [Candidatus Sulfotelmatobacter sp.]